MRVQRGKRQSQGRKGRKKETGTRRAKLERHVNRLLVELIASAALFLVVFVGGGLIPNRVCDVFSQVHLAISENNHLLQSVQALGSAVSEGESWPQAIRDWCVDTFLPSADTGEEGPEEQEEPEAQETEDPEEDYAPLTGSIPAPKGSTLWSRSPLFLPDGQARGG